VSTPRQPETGVKPQKQRLNVYTMMLIASLMCLICACVLMYLELQRYIKDGAWPPWQTTSLDSPAVAKAPLNVEPAKTVRRF